MIEQSDEQVVEWARAVVPNVNVAVAPPPANGSTPGVFITLLNVAPVAAPRGTRRPPLEVALEYLVSTAGDDVTKTHAWLGALAFAAMDVATWTVSTDSVPLQLWQAFNVAPRPAFVVRVPLRLEREQPRVPLVRQPLVVDGSQVAHVAGRVIGPGGLPIAGAKVRVPALQLSAETDPDGAFHFPSVPADTPVSVVVNAKGQVLRLQTRAGEDLRVELNENELEG